MIGRSLCLMEYCTNLMAVEFLFSYNNIGDKGAGVLREAISYLERSESLQSFQLLVDNCNIGDEGIS